MDPYTYDRRAYRRMYRRQNPLRGLAGGIFILFLLLAFLIGRGAFLPLFFVGLAACALIASLSTFHPRGIYSGLVGATWLLGLALCFAVGFWPWILLPVAVSMILGALIRPITGVLTGPAFLPPNQPQQQPYQPPYQQQAPAGTYQEGSSPQPYPPEQPPEP
jgi:hypothetical protein